MPIAYLVQFYELSRLNIAWLSKHEMHDSYGNANGFRCSEKAEQVILHNDCSTARI